MYENIPMELRQLPQWCCAGPDKIPLNPRTGQRANPVDPATWGTFEQATRSGMRFIGLMLSKGDPYCIVDLDDKEEDPATEEEIEVIRKVLSRFHSYTERSAGGRGFHIVTRARLDAGRRRRPVEVYSDGRFMIFTGNVVKNLPIVDCQKDIDAIVAQMPVTLAGDLLEDVESNYSDAELHDMALNAVNGDKYNELCNGDWQAMGYPSQSEADFALLSIIAFYTRDNEQVRRLFRCTRLGKREKAQRDNRYIDTALRKIRAHESSEVDLAAIRDDYQQWAANRWRPASDAAEHVGSAGPAATDAPRRRAPVPPASRAAVNGKESVAVLGGRESSSNTGDVSNARRTAPPPAAKGVRPSAKHSYSLTPPGLVGEVAQYIYSSSVRPVREVALCAAIGLVAGIIGRCYNISGTGLNQYILFVARTGTGKEEGPKGVERLMAAVRPRVPMIDEFLGPGSFASGQGLIRCLDAKPSFVSMLGEMGLTLQMLNDPRAPSSSVMLKKVLLDLYAKSGWNSVLRSTAYSDSEKNTKTIFAPNVTFVGDTTPETFFDSLSTADIADGLIPRLHIVEYKGERPRRNKTTAGAPPEGDLTTKVEDLAAQALQMAQNSQCANVQCDGDALELLDAFDEECDDLMRKEHSSVAVQLWNRAHLKALKVAGLLAVGCDLHQPVVTKELAVWAIAFVREGTRAILSRFEIGDVGQGETKQGVELRRIVEDYFQATAEQLKKYKAEPSLQKQGLVPYSYIVVRASRLSCFQRDRRGSAKAIRETLEQGVDVELLGVVPKVQAENKFGKKELLYFRGANW